MIVILLFLNTVESYDVLPDRWSPMPAMNSAKVGHSLVVVRNKLFVISKQADTCEVYDNTCKKFITIKSPDLSSFYSVTTYSIGNKIYVLLDDLPKLICYDVEKNKWSEATCEVKRDLRYFSYVKVPCL